jgi:Rho-binding antiterminator
MKYQPIDCNFYDILEANAVLRKQVEIIFLDEHKALQTVQAVIKDLYIKEKAEYMKLANEQEIRLDRLISVDGKELNGSCAI